MILCIRLHSKSSEEGKYWLLFYRNVCKAANNLGLLGNPVAVIQRWFGDTLPAKKVNRYVDSTCFPHTHKMTKLENQGLEEAVVRWRPAAGGTYSL